MQGFTSAVLDAGPAGDDSGGDAALAPFEPSLT